MLINRIKEESAILEKEILNTEKELKKLPQGRISFYMNGKYTKWFHVGVKEAKFISKKRRDFATKLAIKEVLETRLEVLRTDYSNLQQYVAFHESSDMADIIKSMNNREKLEPLLSDTLSAEKAEFYDWMNEPYQKSEKYIDQLRFTGMSGTMLRSKSEVLIEQALWRNNIAFRYECLLQLHDIDLYPDFTIRIKNRGGEGFKTIIWEHFGMIDVPEYFQRVMQKLKLYNENGYVQGHNFIATFETNEFPLGLQEVDRIVEMYLLD